MTPLDGIPVQYPASISITIDADHEDKVVYQPDESNRIWCCNSIKKRNAMRVLSAGGLSCAGGLVAGFAPTTPWIIIGSTLAGLGNALSSILCYETTDVPDLQARVNIMIKERTILKELYQENEALKARLLEQDRRIQQIESLILAAPTIKDKSV